MLVDRPATDTSQCDHNRRRGAAAIPGQHGPHHERDEHRHPGRSSEEGRRGRRQRRYSHLPVAEGGRNDRQQEECERGLRQDPVRKIEKHGGHREETGRHQSDPPARQRFGDPVGQPHGASRERERGRLERLKTAEPADYREYQRISGRELGVKGRSRQLNVSEAHPVSKRFTQDHVVSGISSREERRLEYQDGKKDVRGHQHCRGQAPASVARKRRVQAHAVGRVGPSARALPDHLLSSRRRSSTSARSPAISSATRPATNSKPPRRTRNTTRVRSGLKPVPRA